MSGSRLSTKGWWCALESCYLDEAVAVEDSVLSIQLCKYLLFRIENVKDEIGVILQSCSENHYFIVLRHLLNEVLRVRPDQELATIFQLAADRCASVCIRLVVCEKPNASKQTKKTKGRSVIALACTS